eukprot:CAMPEP_0194256734 /NCGR_PEP_ID=MMETSP0158-20130606/37437_1 /TAXON_ID=33649 /ORGANISM="Thalassionema nitzschioides, Strain L26-B" /LENGTH=47 /DNA_ID= /DNA_START= /DNA_END= /DNA_ORIENTATION=
MTDQGFNESSSGNCSPYLKYLSPSDKVSSFTSAFFIDRPFRATTSSE